MWADRLTLTAAETAEKLAPGTTSLAGKVAIVTGSSSGIGMGVATGLYRMGATVVVTSRSVAKAEKACKSIEQFVASDPRATDVAGALAAAAASMYWIVCATTRTLILRFMIASCLKCRGNLSI